MPSTFTSAALLGLSALAAAVPMRGLNGDAGTHWTQPSSAYQPGPTTSATATNPFKFPLGNGFPNISNPSSQLTAIELQAHGTLPNGPPPATVQPDTLTSLRLIAFNELFEVAFFTSLLSNITSNVPGFQVGSNGLEQFVVNALTAIVAQEELHELNANGALAHFNAGPIQPCEYKFPTSNFDDAIALASTFTDVVLGTLQDVQQDLGADGDIGLIRGVGSVIGQEGEQNGYFRSLLGKIPSALPFLTTSTREFAFSALNQNFVVPGSCPNINTIALPIFGALNVLTKNIEPKSQDIQFSIAADGSNTSLDGLNVVYINQQNLPVVEPIMNPQNSNGVITFTATFPFDQFLMNGLTIAAIAEGTTFASADAVAKATKFGPGLIEIN